jgi:heat shock protein HtpX
MAGTTDFVAAQAVNRRNTLLLLVVLTLMAALTGYAIGWILESQLLDYLPVLSATGLVAAAVLALASITWSLVSLAFGDRMVLSMADAREIQRAEAPQLYNVVEEMALAAGVPAPTVRIMETDAMNSFATGTTPARGTIVVTRGLLDQLNRDELQGVVAHEMAHLANLDTRYMVVVGVTVGLIALVCDGLLRTLNWGMFASQRRSEDRTSKPGSAGLAIVLLIVIAVLAPVAAKAVQMAVSRQREYLADATAVQFTRNPEGLISALTKLEAAAKPFPGVSHATQHLFIVNPVQRATPDTSALMATHPDIESRIARLRNLGG